MNPFILSHASASFDPLADIDAFHKKFGLSQENEKVAIAEPYPDKATLKEVDDWKIQNRSKLSPEEWNFRLKRLVDEVVETQVAHDEKNDVELLDGLVDTIYIALGTAYRRGWDFAEAWNRVHRANMSKERGDAKNSPYGSSFDIVKPSGWNPPNLDDLV